MRLDLRSTMPDVMGTGATSSRNPRFFVGQRVGNLELLQLLGTGSFGEVYRAVDLRLGRQVAVKMITRQMPHDDGRFHREARALAALSHPNVVTMFDVGEVEGHPFIVMELLRGETLRARLEAGAPSLQEALLWGRDLLRGLSAVHQVGLVHLDLKPENLFVAEDARLKVLDFGIARDVRVAHDARLGIAGTLSYMAPEQLAGLAVDARTDLFAVGVLLHELIVGRHPFQGSSAEATAHAIRSAPPLTPPGAVWPDPRLAEVVDACLAKDPRQRPQSADELLALLAPFIEAEAGGVPTEIGHVEVDQGQLAYRIFGQGSRDVLVVPGLLSHVDMWTHGPEGVAALRAMCQGRRVIIPDRCGRGASDRLPDTALPSLEDELEHLAAVLDATAARRPLVVATDESCALALAFAATHAERVAGLVLLDAAANRREELARRAEQWGTPESATAALGEGATAALRAWWTSWERMTCARQVARALVERAAQLDVRCLLPLVDVPTTFVRGRADDAGDAGDGLDADERAAWVAAMPRGRVVEVGGAPRFLPLIEPAAWAELLAPPADAAPPPRSIACFVAVERRRDQLDARSRTRIAAEHAGWTVLRIAFPTEAMRLAQVLAEAEGGEGAPRVIATVDRDAAAAWAAIEPTAGAATPGVVELAAPLRAVLPAFTRHAPPTDDGSHRRMLEVAPLEHQSFRIELVGPWRLRFSGNLTMRDPAQLLLPHLEAIHAIARGCRRLAVDVRLLRHVNSAALGAFIQWAGWIRTAPPDQRYRLILITDRAVLWQRSSLPALSTLAADVLELQ